MYNPDIQMLLPELPRMSLAELADGRPLPVNSYDWSTFNWSLKRYLGENSNTAVMADMIAAGTPPVNLVTGGENTGAVIMALVQNDIQRSNDIRLSNEERQRSALAQLELERRQMQPDNAQVKAERERQLKLADLEAYSLAYRGADEAAECSAASVSRDGMEPPAQARAISNDNTPAMQYVQGREDFLHGGRTQIEFNPAEVRLPAGREHTQDVAKIAIPAAALASASRLGASINQFATCTLEAANTISAPAALGARRSGVELSRAA